MQKNQIQKSFQNQAGMTLVEIMIVLAIVGSMMALLLPRITGQLDKSKQKEAKIQMAQIVNAISMYYSDCGTYPQSLENLVTQDANCPNWGPEAYIKKSPKDPWKKDFAYEISDGSYTLTCYGKDGREGGAGFDADITQDDVGQ